LRSANYIDKLGEWQLRYTTNDVGDDVCHSSQAMLLEGRGDVGPGGVISELLEGVDESDKHDPANWMSVKVPVIRAGGVQ
jgi:hypothetical protein